MTSSSASLSTRVPELDGLRGLAILLVLVYHYTGGADAHFSFWPRHILGALSIGWSGVDLFFVLSGFLIGGILLDARNSPRYFRAFYMRRVFRILPIYYVWTLLYGVLLLYVLWREPGRFPLSLNDLSQVPLHLLFLQNIWFTRLFFPSVWFAVTWSLAVEEQFYLITPPLIRFFDVRKVTWILAATICAAPLIRTTVYRITQDSFAASFPMPCRADSLACGVLLAIAWRKPAFHDFLRAHPRLLRNLLLVLFLGVGALLWWLVRPDNLVQISIGYTWIALFYACLLLFTLKETQTWLAALMRWRFLRWLGGISYCVYLIHLTFNFIAHALLHGGLPEIYTARGVAAAVLALAATLAVASLSWRFFEKPLIRRGHTYSYGESSASATPRDVLMDTAPAQP